MASLDARSIKEERLVAAMSLQVLKFTAWETWEKEGSTILIGVHGSKGLAKEFAAIAVANDCEVEVVEDSFATSDLSRFDVVFFSGENLGLSARLMAKVEGLPVLLMGDIEEFLEMGGMVYFHSKQSRLTFDIDLSNSRKKGIGFRAKLLRLADRVVNDE
ncbi:YfiR family protein [Puniceicoccaceae bacterium K14]|nr:YfiR family protein [Puniceicoccaceae bacterium K14]